jgi:hypothetical protein
VEDPGDFDEAFAVVDGVENPVIAYSHAPIVGIPSELYDAGRARVRRESEDMRVDV